jgi:hypothetical protein
MKIFKTITRFEKKSEIFEEIKNSFTNLNHITKLNFGDFYIM